jgi:hypothetical protein
MTNELDPDEYIEQFESGGPKNYVFGTVNARNLEKKTVCKVRGITLNYAVAQLVNFDSIRGMFLCVDAKNVITVRTERKIKRKMVRCDGIGLPRTDSMIIVSEPNEKVC